jgi:CheY-like chemotaxis protein
VEGSTQLLDASHTATVENGNRPFRVLLVDDDPWIRNILSAVLIRAGFEVLTASDGQEAWTLFRHALPRIGALVTDIEMPEMSGLELAKLATCACPELPILVISGLPFHSEAQRIGCDFLQKPFGPSVFLKSVHSLIGTSGVV